MGRKANSGGGRSSNNLGSSSAPAKGKGSKDKIKLADPSSQNVTVSLTAIPKYDLPLENGESMDISTRKNPQDPDWGDAMASEFEDLLLHHMKLLFDNATKQIVKCGYSEEIALKAISRWGLYHGGKDLVLNIVNDAVDFLKNGKERDFLFEDLQQLVEYTLVEMVNVLREVKLSLCTPEAMWWLLVCDLNISQACAVEDLLSEFGGKEVSRESSSDADSILQHSKKDFQAAESEISNPNNPKPDARSNLPQPHKMGGFYSFPNTKDHIDPEVSAKDKYFPAPGSLEKTLAAFLNSAYQTQANYENPKSGGKVHKKENAAFQKSSHMERCYKHGGKVDLKTGKVAAVGGPVVEKRTKHPSELAGVQKKGRFRGKGKAQAPVVDIPDGTMSAAMADNFSKFAAMWNSTIPPMIDAANASKRKASYPKISDYYAAIPYDKSLGKYVPQDGKDEVILTLLPRVQELENDLQKLTDWANEKVIVAARRLNIDKPELKALRQDKKEAEQFKKERTMLEEYTVKSLLDVESALASVTSQVECSNSTVSRLEVENSLLKKEMVVAKLQAEKSAASCKEALEKEQKAIRDAQSGEGQKGMLLEELEVQKQKVVRLHEALSKKKNILNQIEARWAQEKTAKEMLLVQANTLRNERAKLEAEAKAAEDLLVQKLADKSKKHMESIRKLEIEMSKLKFKSDASEMTDLWKGIIRDRGVRDKKDDNFTWRKVPDSWGGGLRRERECVMCLSEEMSVVFLPCAHQVLCAKCNELHKKQGMKECPSCRTPIKWRVPARFAGS